MSFSLVTAPCDQLRLGLEELRVDVEFVEPTLFLRRLQARRHREEVDRQCEVERKDGRRGAELISRVHAAQLRAEPVGIAAVTSAESGEPLVPVV